MTCLPSIAKKNRSGIVRAKLLGALAGLLLAALPVQSAVIVEGEIQGSARDGYYDLDLTIRSREDGKGPFLIRQSVRMVRVPVAARRFRISLETGLEAYPLEDLEFQIRFRPFDAFGEFQAGVNSHISFPAHPDGLALQSGSEPSGKAPIPSR